MAVVKITYVRHAVKLKAATRQHNQKKEKPKKA